MALASAIDLASKNTAHFPNESPEYREARNKLLAEEIDLRRHIAAVAEQRRALPLGGEVPEDYTVVGADGPVTFSSLFGANDTLIVYSYMFGPQRKAACPMCTSTLASWDGPARNLPQWASLAVFARSPMERLDAWKQERGWQFLRFFSDMEGAYTRAYVSPDDADVPAINVFTKRDGRMHHFWSGEIGPGMNDPGQDGRGAPDPDALWMLLDMTPEGRRATEYPSLDGTPKPMA